MEEAMFAWLRGCMITLALSFVWPSIVNFIARVRREALEGPSDHQHFAHSRRWQPVASRKLEHQSQIL